MKIGKMCLDDNSKNVIVIPNSLAKLIVIPNLFAERGQVRDLPLTIS